MVKQLAFTPADHQRIAEAIRAAEAHTSGEIFAVFARRSDGYFFISGFFALALSFALAFAAAVGLALAGVALPPLAFELAQLAGAVALLFLLRLSPALRMLFVPEAIRRQRAHRMALAQFLSHNIHATAGRTGVLIFVSEAERYAEIVADAGINALAPQAEWDEIARLLVEAARADRLADGYVEAAARAGALLTAHFPADGKNPNEIPDRLVEI